MLVGHALRLLSIYVGLPNAILWYASLLWVLPRPAVNLDYALVALLHPWAGAVGGGLMASVLALLDVVVAGAYRYCGDPACVLVSAPDLALLPVTYTLPIALVGLVATTALAMVVASRVRVVPRNVGPNLLAAAAAFVVAACSLPFAPGPRPEERAVVLGDFLQNALLPAIRPAPEFRGLAHRPVASATAPLFRAVRSGARLPQRIVLVVVESWGRFRDPRTDSLARAAIDLEALEAAYRVERGQVPHFGGTVKGELRELCQGESATARPDPAVLPVDECLPALLDSRGYSTVAMHGFRSDFFDRASWWPGMGFDSVLFRDEMATALGTSRTCGKEWEGVCDADAASLLGTMLERTERSSSRPRFLYWLTLNSHAPYRSWPEDAASHGCAATPPAFTVPAEVCRAVAWQSVVLEAVSDLALEHADGRTAWLIVGDHPPRLSETRLQQHVKPDSVPWLRLWPTESRGAAAAVDVDPGAGASD